MMDSLKRSLNELIELLERMNTSEAYTLPISVLGNSSIGHHTRHVIEFFQALLQGYQTGVVCYDDRIRSNTLETDHQIAANELRRLHNQVEKPDKKMKLISHSLDKNENLSTSYYRELYFNFEHCIHHQALIHVALRAMSSNIVSEEFGIAPSTLEYRKKCVQ